MTQGFKIGDVVRYGVDKQGFPIYDYARGHSANFAEYVTAEIISVGLVSFITRLNSAFCWNWPRNKPSHHEAKYWPHLLSDADKIDGHEAMHLFLRPESADKMKTVTLTAPNIHPLTAADLAPTPTKESSMSKHILALAASRHSAPETTPLSGRLQDALKVAMEKQAQESAEAAAAEILSMIRALEVSKEQIFNAIVGIDSINMVQLKRKNLVVP